MSLVMNVGASTKAVAPQISAETLEQPGKFDAAYRQWKQHELAKGTEACSFQQCFAENLLRVLTKRRGIKFGAAEQTEKETDEQFSARRKRDAAEAAEKIFAMIAPKSAVDESEFILKTCTFKYEKKKGPLSMQVSMHECKYGDAIQQLGDKLTDLKKIKLYIKCFNEDMQRELKFAGAADEKTGKKAFSTWADYADEVTGMADEIEKAEARRGLFGMPGARTTGSKALEGDSGNKQPEPPPPKEQEVSGPAANARKGRPCFRCGEYGHIARECPNEEVLAEARRKTPKETKFDFQPHSGRANFQKHRADSPHSSSRYPDRDRQKPDRYAASAVKKAVGEAKMKTRRRIRSRVKDFYKAMDKGARRVTPKDLHELLASDFPDSSDTDGFRSTTESSSSDGDDDDGGGD